MADALAKTVALALGMFACSSQVRSQQKPQDPPPPPILPTLSPPLPPPWILFPQPDPLPSSPDAPMPDLGSLPGPPDKSKSRVKRALDRALPNCLDSVLHTCWSSPPGDGKTLEEREFANDMEIGTFYFRNKNFRGAEMRFRHALDYKPGQPEATFRLAESLDKLGKYDEAKQNYETYLRIQPDGPYVERARSAVQRPAKSAGKN